MLIAKKDAPAAKVYFESGEKVVGMIAVNVQLLIYVDSIDSIKDSLCECENAFKHESKLSCVVVCNDELNAIESFATQNNLTKLEIYKDSQKQFQIRFKITDENIGVFLVDKEGILEYVYYGDSASLDTKNIIQNAVELANRKQKGHTHENWMM
ncbi:hypothetical protein [Arcobacter sp. FWKO B]|uniref:hypothetical protein n=1 Tax=Arcobacter sp. FWKO B TaxID=2593672 RepID=UPI0018A53A45|nr:hypothetical protein [Arcobacter sp. FWKO B]QOG11276.1 hypothetical protein FWKOB_00580 [Arcobacter sp. FWKO B]